MEKSMAISCLDKHYTNSRKGLRKIENILYVYMNICVKKQMKGQNTNGQKYKSILDAHAPPLCNFKLTLEFLMVTVLRQTRAIIGTEARESRIRLNQIHQHILFQFN